jgi:hypothetical protein
MSEIDSTSPQAAVNETRGVLFSLVIIPAGIIVWGILWNFGFIASIVGWGVALGAMYLYRRGTGGRLTKASAILITVITVVTLCLAFFGGIVLDGLQGFSQASGISPFALFFNSQFWSSLFGILGEPGVLGSYTPDFLFALLFGALGCFQVIRSAFREAKAVTPGVGASEATTDVDADAANGDDQEPPRP